ncbi:MAG: hypothetical protein H0V62_03815 [Gammaproteobacteria bacterium]|nr:hypothetical protein [Gammaproteobacteria bacterium]
MKRFPPNVRQGMQKIGAAATCVTVQLDAGEWEAALFVQLAGEQCERDRRALVMTNKRMPVGIETEVIEHEEGAVVMLRLEVYALPDDPMLAEILLTPGGAGGHFEVLQCLSRQPRLCWFFGDEDYRVLSAQQHGLVDDQRAEFDRLRLDAVKHDAVVRCTGRYNAQSALGGVASYYQLHTAG